MNTPLEEAEKVSQPKCHILCPDDLCRNNPSDTLCGGSYCGICRDPLRAGFDICEDCDESSYENYDDSYEGLL